MSEWISVEERMPDEGKSVIVFVGFRVMAAYRRTTKYHKNPEKVAPWSDARGCVFRGVTHWMPLPEPPK